MPIHLHGEGEEGETRVRSVLPIWLPLVDAPLSALEGCCYHQQWCAALQKTVMHWQKKMPFTRLSNMHVFE